MRTPSQRRHEAGEREKNPGWSTRFVIHTVGNARLLLGELVVMAVPRALSGQIMVGYGVQCGADERSCGGDADH